MSPRLRWVLAVTAAEAIGYVAVAIAGVAAFRVDLPPVALMMITAGAGFVEGAALGTGQAYALPFRVRRLRFALFTGTAAVFACAVTLLAAAALVLLPVAAAVGGAAIGYAQWRELRHHRAGAYRWIGWTVLAWALALPLGLVPGLLVTIDVALNGDSTPFVAHVALWGAGGPLTGAVVAVITWHGVKRLAASAADPSPAREPSIGDRDRAAAL